MTQAYREKNTTALHEELDELQKEHAALKRDHSAQQRQIIQLRERLEQFTPDAKRSRAKKRFAVGVLVIIGCFTTAGWLAFGASGLRWVLLICVTITAIRYAVGRAAEMS